MRKVAFLKEERRVMQLGKMWVMEEMRKNQKIKSKFAKGIRKNIGMIRLILLEKSLEIWRLNIKMIIKNKVSTPRSPKPVPPTPQKKKTTRTSHGSTRR